MRLWWPLAGCQAQQDCSHKADCSVPRGTHQCDSGGHWAGGTSHTNRSHEVPPWWRHWTATLPPTMSLVSRGAPLVRALDGHAHVKPRPQPEPHPERTRSPRARSSRARRPKCSSALKVVERAGRPRARSKCSSEHGLVGSGRLRPSAAPRQPLPAGSCLAARVRPHPCLPSSRWGAGPFASPPPAPPPSPVVRAVRARSRRAARRAHPAQA